MIGQENHTFVKLYKEYTVGFGYAMMKHNPTITYIHLFF